MSLPVHDRLRRALPFAGVLQFLHEAPPQWWRFSYDRQVEGADVQPWREPFQFFPQGSLAGAEFLADGTLRVLLEVDGPTGKTAVCEAA